MELDAAAETVCRAIANRHRLTFKCGEKTCVAEPHELGCDASGALVLLAYLVEGEPAGASGGTASGGAASGNVSGERWVVYRVEDFEWALEGTEPFDWPSPGHGTAPVGVISSPVCQL